MIHFVVGTRAQLLKLAPVMRECTRRGLAWRWIYTAQHRETMPEIVSFFELPEAHHSMLESSNETKSTGRMARWLFDILVRSVRPARTLDCLSGPEHIVVTHGDTFSTVVGALLGRLSRTPVLHVEAGLRSFRLFDPFPEELNRIIVSRLSALHACPDAAAARNLAGRSGSVFETGGNTQIDILRHGLANLHHASLTLPQRPYAVASFHRYENLYDRNRLDRLIRIVESAAERMSVAIPLHPITRSRLYRLGLLSRLDGNSRLQLLPRLDYINYLKLIEGSELTMTDGGGNQEELSYLGIPTLLLRDRSERDEGLGRNAVLSKLDPVVSNAFLDHYADYRRPLANLAHSPSQVIVDRIDRFGGAS